MSYGTYMGKRLTRQSAFEIALVSKCDECGEECRTDDMHEIDSGTYCDGCIEEAKEQSQSE